MTIELKLLGWSIVLGLVYVLFATMLATQQRGLAWNASNRDGEPQPLTGAAARADRASRNFLETFVFFAAAVLGVVLAQRTSASSALGVQLYVWARVAYLPIYVVGIPYLRTLVWAVSVAGIVMVLGALL
ncbi:MAPEG family protein [Dyella sp. 20L07]|uniref:MAPEG family protein n=1 Tax=Dyella sp. 20L07 TaxID=3384240 RepID=UPI003D2A77EC